MGLFLVGGRAFYAAGLGAQVGAVIADSTKNLPRKSGASIRFGKPLIADRFPVRRAAPSR